MPLKRECHFHDNVGIINVKLCLPLDIWINYIFKSGWLSLKASQSCRQRDLHTTVFFTIPNIDFRVKFDGGSLALQTALDTVAICKPFILLCLNSLLLIISWFRDKRSCSVVNLIPAVSNIYSNQLNFIRIISTIDLELLLLTPWMESNNSV